MTKAIICGSRDIDSFTLVTLAMHDLIREFDLDITEVISGCANGVDKLGERWAMKNFIPIKRFPANWKLHGKAAGPIRNQQMVDYADITIAITNGSVGTEHTIRMSKEKGIPTYVRRI